MSLAYFPSPSRIVGPLVIGSGGAQIAADANGRITASSPSTGTTCFRAGRGKALGAPPGTITTATGGAGALTGVYQYAYTETDANGETTRSAAASYTASAEKIQVTVPLPRRGTGERKLYRTTAGGSIFKLLHNFGGGDEWFQTIYVDNALDGSLGATAPTSDTTSVYELEVNAGVKYARTHPDQLTGAADWTFTTGDPATAGAYGIDNYGEYKGRTARGNGVGILATGTSCNAFQAQWLGDTVDGVAAATTFEVDSVGRSRIVLAQPMTDAVPYAFRVTGTMPTTITQGRSGVAFAITGAGSSSFFQNALSVNFLAGYTGNQTCIGVNSVNATAGTAGCVGVFGYGQAGTRAIGVAGEASGGTDNIGVLGTLNVTVDGITGQSGAIIGTNGVTTKRILGLFDNTTLSFEVQDGGYVVANGATAPGVADSTLNVGNPTGGILGRGTPGSGGANVRAVSGTGGGNNFFWGHSNTGFLSTIGATSGGGIPFLGFFCYHGPTANTLRYSSGSNVPVMIQSGTSGVLTIQQAAAGTVDTDITFTTRWTLDATNGNVTMTGNLTMADAKNLVLNTSTGTKIGTATSQKLGLWNATPVVQPASANQAALTDSTGGTADGTVADVGSSFSQATLNNNFADIIRLVNQMRNDLVTIGALKGSA